jgi:hypothetical protein
MTQFVFPPASITITGSATAANQVSEIALLTSLDNRLAGSLVPEAFDYQALTYVAAGNGAGEVETVTYKTGGSGGTTVATLTLTYDSSNRVASVTRS